MGKTTKPLPVKLIVSLMALDTSLFDKTGRILSKKFGKIDYKSAVFDFNQTAYYEKEMGKDLKRQFLSFKNLVASEQLVKIKLFTNKMELKLALHPAVRTINIDPGYLTLSKLILATTKNHSHRIYAGKGIFQEVTLFFKGGSFQANPWTYPDYKTEGPLAVFNDLREKYRHQIEEKYGRSRLSRCP